MPLLYSNLYGVYYIYLSRSLIYDRPRCHITPTFFCILVYSSTIQHVRDVEKERGTRYSTRRSDRIRSFMGGMSTSSSSTRLSADMPYVCPTQLHYICTGGTYIHPYIHTVGSLSFSKSGLSGAHLQLEKKKSKRQGMGKI